MVIYNSNKTILPRKSKNADFNLNGCIFTIEDKGNETFNVQVPRIIHVYFVVYMYNVNGSKIGSDRRVLSRLIHVHDVFALTALFWERTVLVRSSRTY